MDHRSPDSDPQSQKAVFETIRSNLERARQDADFASRLAVPIQLVELCGGYWTESRFPESMSGTVASGYQALDLWRTQSEKLAEATGEARALVVSVNSIAVNVGLVTETLAQHTPEAGNRAQAVRQVLDSEATRRKVTDGLRKLSLTIADEYTQAWKSVDAPTDDPGRSAMFEMREVLSHVLRSLAPDYEVMTWPQFVPDPDQEAQGKNGVTRRARVRYIAQVLASSSSDADAIIRNEDSYVSVFEDLNKVHACDSIPLAEARSVLNLCDELLQIMLRATGYIADSE